MTARFQDKVVLITGGGSGIGLAAAKAFAREGASVAIVDRHVERADIAARNLRATGASTIAIGADVAEPRDCLDMVRRTVEEFGALHVAFNNAAIPSSIVADFADYRIEEWNSVLRVNVSGIFNSMLAEVPAMIRFGGHAIVNTASMASTVATPGMASYVTSKHAVAGLTKTTALDLVRHGIRVNAICPGFVDTPMLATAMSDPAARSQIESMIPAGRIARPEEVAESVLFLAAAESSYLVGALLTVDGGVVIQ